jgi:O-antigen/teichoic acid export membrane protein
MGWKLKSLPMTGALCWAFSSAGLLWACCRLRVFPRAGAWGRPSRKRFLDLLLFGKDVFLVTLGNQFIMASQTIIVTRVMGLDAAAVWTVCTKTFALVSQLIWRIFDFSSSVFVEMFVRRETVRLLERFRGVVMVTATFGVFVGVMFAVTNDSFVVVWTGGKVGWANLNNCLLALWLVIVSVLRCHNGQVMNTKKLGFLRYVYFVEGVVFIGMASWLARQGGFASMLMTSIVCSLCFSGTYGLWRTMGYFNLSLREVLWNWLLPALKLLILLAPWAAAVYYALQGQPEWWRLAGNTLLVGLPGLYLLLRLGIPRPMREEISRRVPRRYSPVVRLLFAS